MVFVIRPNQLGGNRCNYCYPTNTNTTLILYTSLNSTAASSPWTPAGNPEVGHHLVCSATPGTHDPGPCVAQARHKVQASKQASASSRAPPQHSRALPAILGLPIRSSTIDALLVRVLAPTHDVFASLVGGKLLAARRAIPGRPGLPVCSVPCASVRSVLMPVFLVRLGPLRRQHALRKQSLITA